MHQSVLVMQNVNKMVEVLFKINIVSDFLEHLTTNFCFSTSL